MFPPAPVLPCIDLTRRRVEVEVRVRRARMDRARRLVAAPRDLAGGLPVADPANVWTRPEAGAERRVGGLRAGCC
jgi:hypothetical protein